MGLPSISIVSPVDLSVLSFSLCKVEVIYSDNADQYIADSVLIEFDTVSTFDSANKKISTFTLVASAIPCIMAAILSDGNWFLRVTATNSSGTSVSQISFNVLRITKTALYTNVNVAKYNQWQKRALVFYENIGKLDVWSNTRALYEYENITTDPPFPTLETLSCYRGPAGSTITLHGNGFGSKTDIDISNTDRSLRGYGGAVYIGEMICNIISWSWTDIVIQIPNTAETGGIKVVLTAPVTVESKSIGFEIYEAEQTLNTGLEYFVCDKTNPNQIICQLNGAKKKSFQSILNNCGSGSFSISRFDEKGGNSDYISEQNFILCRLDGIDLFKFVVESISPDYVAEDGQQMIDVTGRGLLSILGKAVVYPEGMPTPSSLTREWKNAHGAAIFRTLILEAQARGCFPGMHLDWDGDNDSLGNAFTDSTDVSFHAGAPLTDVIDKLTEGMGLFDVEMTPSLNLRVYKKRGEDKSDEIIYQPGHGITSSKKQTDSTELANVLLVEGSDSAIAETLDTDSYLIYGRKEGYLQASDLPLKQLEAQGQTQLKNSSTADWTIQGDVVKIVKENGSVIKPYETYLLGDWIKWYIPPEGADTKGINSKVRVKGITCSENDDTGALSYTLDLNNVKKEREIRLAQKLQRLTGSSATSSSYSPPTSTSATAGHNHTHSTLNGLDSDDHPQYLNEDRHAADSHSGIARVSSIKKNGGNALTGDVTMIPGTNVNIEQDDENKTLTISASGGSSGTSYANPIDEPPAVPSAYDDEFDGTSLKSKWTRIRSTIGTVSLENEHIVIDYTPSTADNGTAILQAITGDFSVVLNIKEFLGLGDAARCGIALVNNISDSTNLYSFALSTEGDTYIKLAVQKWTNLSTWSANPKLFIIGVQRNGYLKVSRVGTTINYYWSLTGIRWVQIYSHIPDFTIGAVGIMISTRNNRLVSVCDWFRVTTP